MCVAGVRSSALTSDMASADILKDMDAGDHSVGFSPLCVILLSLEIYHAFSHICILFRLRMLPKKDLVRVKVYFLVDLLTVASSAMYTGKMLWLAALQNAQHLFFYFTWNKNWYCIRVSINYM